MCFLALSLCFVVVAVPLDHSAVGVFVDEREVKWHNYIGEEIGWGWWCLEVHLEGEVCYSKVT